MTQPVRRRVPPWSMAITAMLVIQFSSALSVTVIEQVGPGGTAWLRMCCGAVLLAMIVRPRLASVSRGDIPALLALGFATGFMVVLFLFAIERIPLGTAVAVEFLGPLTVAAVASKSRSALAWPVLALMGVVALTEPWHGEINLAGVGFALAAGACWGLYNVFTQHIGDRYSGISGLALTIPIAAVLTAPVGLPQVLGGNAVWWVLLLAAGIALLSPVISFGLEMAALRRMHHSAFGTLLAVEPALAVLIGLIVLNQRPSALQIVGITLVVIAGAAAQRGAARDTTASADLTPPPPQ